MRRVFCVFALAGLMTASGIAAGKNKNLYAVTHIDIAGAGSRLTEVISLIKEFAADSQKDPGAVRFEVLQQDAHPNHFTIFEVWESRQAFDAHLAAPHTKRFRDKLQPMLGSPFREGLHRLL
jgi:quinol monooxygenase YgiN